MKRAVALMLTLSMFAGCFPHNRKARMYSQLGEGGAIVAGVASEFLVNQDCDTTTPLPGQTSSCHSHAAVLGDVGVGLILAGLLGFVATISTADDDDDKKPPVIIKAEPKPEDKLPAVVLPPAPPATPAPSTEPATPAPAPSS